MATKNQLLAEIIASLNETTDDDAERAVFTGLACGKSPTSLHVATAAGVISVPLDDIEDIGSIGLDDSKQVKVTVRSSDRVRFIRRPDSNSFYDVKNAPSSYREAFRRGLALLRNSDDIPWPPILGPGVSTQFCLTTVTDGNACDDFECETEDDDLE